MSIEVAQHTVSMENFELLIWFQIDVDSYNPHNKIEIKEYINKPL